MDRYRMTGHKLFWHLDRVLPWIRGERICPLHIELGITNACNLSCRFCYGDLIGKVKPGSRFRFDMPREVIFKLFRDAKEAGVKSITLIGEGENTLSPYFHDAGDHAIGLGMDLAMATNGIAFKKSRVEDVGAFTWIRFSLGGATPESYIKVHGYNQFARVIDNIETCVETKKVYHLRTTLGIQMVVIHDNIQDIVPLARLGKSLGVNYFVAKPCSDSPDNRLHVRHQEYLELEETFKEAESYAEPGVYDVIIKRERFYNLGRNKFQTCYGTAFTIAIDAKGDVAPCGHLLSRKREFKMGNIIDQSFREVVQSDRYWDVQERVQRLDVNRECEENCLHHDMNQFLEMLRTPPQHINFP